MLRTILMAYSLLLLTIAGCDSNEDKSAISTPNEVALAAPWENTDAVGAISSQLGTTLKISSTKGTLFSILETVANHYSTTISVEPSHLLDHHLGRTITSTRQTNFG